MALGTALTHHASGECNSVRVAERTVPGAPPKHISLVSAEDQLFAQHVYRSLVQRTLVLQFPALTAGPSAPQLSPFRLSVAAGDRAEMARLPSSESTTPQPRVSLKLSEHRS